MTIIKYLDCQPKSGVWRGAAYNPKNDQGIFNAEIVPGQQIRIWGTYTNCTRGPQNFDKVFRVGDVCATGSYNLIYTGRIKAIGPKTVTTVGCFKTQRFTPYEFIYKNWDYDSVKIAAHNFEVGQYI